jgi:cobalt/nickel transport system permease protein
VHLLDGVVTEPAIGLALSAAGVVSVSLSLRQIHRRPDPPLAWAGTLGAFVLAAQAINVPVLGMGVSAHAIGSGLLTLVLGPALAIATLATVVVVQALFGDGGYTALAINWLHIAVIPALSMYAAVTLLGRRSRVAAVLGTFGGSLLGAASLSALLVLGAGAEWRLTVPLLLGVQGVAGLAEGLVTAAAVERLFRTAPRLLSSAAAPGDDATGNASRVRPSYRWAALGVGVLIALLPLASRSPDALERVVEHLQPATAVPTGDQAP